VTRARDLPAWVATAVLLAVLAVAAPSFFAWGNLRDLAVQSAPVLLVATGMTLVILVGEIDISVGSQFAVCSVLAALLAKGGVPVLLLPLLMAMVGGLFGALNGALIALLGLPSIIVTLAMLVIWRDSLRWLTEGAWVQDLPSRFQWLGLGQAPAQLVIVGSAIAISLLLAWMLRRTYGGRTLFAVGADKESARLIGIAPSGVIIGVFVAMGALTGMAATLNAIRFTAVPANMGTGLEMKAIAAVVVGGAAITGGRASLRGTVIGVLLLASIGMALVFVGISPFWEKAIQGGIILVALVVEVLLRQPLTGARREALGAR
jgi:rhamnose transport system permease protein